MVKWSPSPRYVLLLGDGTYDFKDYLGTGVVNQVPPLSLNRAAHEYHRALLEEFLHGTHPRLGDVLLAAQAEYMESGFMPELLSIYHLLGDPALTLR